MIQSTEVVFVIDRSGSMSHLRQAVVDGVNSFVKEVQKEPGQGYWTLITFDDYDSARGAGEGFPNIVYDRRPDAEVPEMKPEDYQPRGGTALVDAVCFAIHRTKERLSAIPADPGKRYKILFVIITDGQENASKEYTTAKMREMIAETTAKFDFQFLYLASNVDAFAETGKAGIVTSFNYAGMAGVVASGAVGSGMLSNSPALPWAHNAAGFHEAILSGAMGTRMYKADVGEFVPTAVPVQPQQEPAFSSK